MNWDAKTPETPVVAIQPPGLGSPVDFHELWEYRELLFFLLWREVNGRYRQMALGPLWIIINPLVSMVLFSILFGTLARLPSDGLPYPIFTYVALLPWQFFANGLYNAAQSLRSQQHLIAKVYFPRLLIPLSSVLSALIDFCASFAVLIAMLIFFRIAPSWNMLMLPVLLFIAGTMALGIGLWLACLTVKYHDVAMGLGFAITVWQYLTPVAYSAALIPEKWQLFYRLNPMVSIIDCFRWSLLGTAAPPVWSLALSFLVSLALLVSGIFYFSHTEQTIADDL